MTVSRRLGAVLTVTVVVRLSVFFAFPDVFDFVRTGQIHGSGAYDAYAVNLLETGVYGQTPGVPDAAIPPLYGYVLAGAYAVLGRGALQVILLNIALDVLSITLLVDIGRRLLPRGAIVGVLAGLATALYPYLVFQTLTLIDTSLFITLLHAFVWLMVVLRGRDREDLGTWALAALGGLVLGLGSLTRPILPPFAVLVALWFGFRLSLRQTAARLAPVALGAILIVGVWSARNHQVYGTIVPITTGAGSNFWQGNNPSTVSALRAGYDVQWTAAPENRTGADPGSPEADRELFRVAGRYLRDQPGSIPELLWVKVLVHWSIGVAPRWNPVAAIGRADGTGGTTLPALASNDPVATYSLPLFARIGRTIHVFSWGPLFLLGLLGAALTGRYWRDVSLLWCVQLAMTLVYVTFHPSTRYRAPSDPLLFLFSAYAIVWLGERVARRRSSLPSPPVYGASPPSPP